MTKKILFFLTFLLCLTGGGQLWAQIPVGYTEKIEGTTVGARVLSNGDLDHLTISGPIKGSLINNHPGTSKEVYDNGTTLTSTDSWQKTEKSTAYDDEQYVGYTLTVDDGYCLNISNVAAKLLAGDNTFYWKVVIYDKDGTAQYTSPEKTASKSTTQDLNIPLSPHLTGLTGTVTVKLFLHQDGGSKYFCINYLQLEVNISRMPYSDTYPYTWYFNVPAEQWTESKNQLMNSSSWHNNGNEARLGATSAPANNGIDIIKGLAFSDVTAATSNSEENFTKGTLCLDWTYKWLWMNGKVTIPSLKVGQKVIFTSQNDVTYFSGAGTVDVSSGKEFNITSSGDVTFTVSGGVWSIAVVKNDLTDFSFDLGQTYYGKSTPSSGKIAGAFIGRTNTFKYKLGRDQILRTTMRVDPDAKTLVGKSLADDENIPEFTKSSSNESVLGTSGTACRSAAKKVTYWDIPVNGCGTTNLTYSFAGSDAYNAEDYVQMITIEKDDPVLAFASNFITKTKGEGNFTNTLTLNGLSLPVTDTRAGTVNATYESKNTSVATVSSTGEVTIVAPGVAIIEATVAESNWNNKATKSYTLVVNPTSGTTPDISWINIVEGSTQEVKYNESIIHEATATAGTVKYRIADTSIAELDNKVPSKVTGKGIGSTTVTAYVEPTSTHNYAEISYNVKVISAGELKSFKFIPNNGKVNNGKSITPKLAFPTIPASGVTSLKVTQIDVIDKVSSSVTQTFTGNTISNCDIISVDAFDDLRNNWELDGVNKVFKVNVTINGKKVGKARITVTFESDYYDTATATYDVEVTDAGTRNFSWADGTNPEYYTYEGDFMMLPALTGNSNGNYNYSSGAKNSSSYTEGGENHSALHAYEYDRKWDNNNENFNIKWNNNNIKIGEGFPDFAIETEGISSQGTASVFFGKGEGGNHPDTLMVYCEKAGDVKLRAYDPQDHSIYCDATIHILPISNIESSATTVTSSMTYPYTWDFTTNFNMAEMVGSTDQYWIPMKDNSGNPTGEYTNGYGFFNIDWADTNKNPNEVDRFYKYFIAGASDLKTGYMHQFNGMMLQMKGKTSWANKIDRMRILNYDGTNNRGRLQFIGGYHTMKLFLPGEGKRPSNFKIFVKASGTGHVCIMGTDEKAVSSTVKTLSSDAAIYSFDISDVTYTSNGYILMGFEDARVYWIAMSTEAKSIGTAAGGSDHMASYSYSQTMDYSKSYEANDVDAYVATAVTNVTNEGSSSNPALKVTLVKSNNSVPSGTGVVLKATAAKDAYMIADARNIESYTNPSAPATNLLLGTGTTGCTIYELAGNPTGTESGSLYVPFYLSSKFRDYSVGSGIGNQQNAGYYAYWRVYGTQSMPANYSYLVLDAATYKDTYGKPADINEGAASRIMLAFDDSDDDSGTTGIENVRDSVMDSDAWYTLQGVKVNAPAKGGIYIHKGKKVVVK